MGISGSTKPPDFSKVSIIQDNIKRSYLYFSFKTEIKDVLIYKHDLKLKCRFLFSDVSKIASIKHVSPKRIDITYAPSVENQKTMSQDGISGQFKVKYDVTRDKDAGDLLVFFSVFSFLLQYTCSYQWLFFIFMVLLITIYTTESMPLLLDVSSPRISPAQ